MIFFRGQTIFQRSVISAAENAVLLLPGGVAFDCYQAYDTAVGALQKLLDKRDAQRKEELWNAIIKSEKTYDEILTFITAGQTTEEE